METLGANRDRIFAAIGPCIALPSYEVDESFRRQFLDSDPKNGRFFSIEEGKRPHFDLESYVAARLEAAGIASIERLGLDTYSDSDRFYSYRRATHRGEPDNGRQLSVIGLPD
jgi:copper oxidase (laccase) domain-containing protein